MFYVSFQLLLLNAFGKRHNVLLHVKKQFKKFDKLNFIYTFAKIIDIMRKLSICLMSLFAASVMSVSADNVESLVFYGVGGNNDNVIELAKIGKLSFGANGFSVVQTDGATTTLDYANVMSIKFKKLTNAINALTSDNVQDLLLHFDGQSVWVDGNEAFGADAAVYSANGQRLIGTKYDGSHISVANLPKGVYVFKVGAKSIKFAR